MAEYAAGDAHDERKSMMKRVYWQFLDEVDGISNYVESAIKQRNRHKDMSDMYVDMAKEESVHAEKLLNAMRKMSIEKDDAADLLADFMDGQLVKARAMLIAFE